MGENEPPRSAYAEDGEAGFEGVRVRIVPLVERLKDDGLTENSESGRPVLPSILRRRDAGAGRFALLQLDGAALSGVVRCRRSMSKGDRPRGPREGGRLPE